ncbi:MAG TPA: DUF4189 domain-containing protein [Xanthobacteraceae bacterium]
MATALFMGAMLAPRTGAAEGALAVGMPANVARMGFAYGSSLNSATMAKARAGAIDGCRGALGNASADLRKLCKVVATFRNQCFAVAMDPADGTPGVGWAIAENQEMADREAIEQCRTTAGSTRQQFCTLDVQAGARSRGCDGAAK